MDYNEEDPFASFEDLTNLLLKMQKKTFTISGDNNQYKPYMDPRDFNVLWRSYIYSLGQRSELLPRIQDDELDMFEKMNIGEQISKLNIFLRSEFYYCYLCGKQYALSLIHI